MLLCRLYCSVSVMYIVWFIFSIQPATYSQSVTIYNYTAITHCKNGCVIVGDEVVFRSTVDISRIPDIKAIFHYELKRKNETKFQWLCYLDLTELLNENRDDNCFLKSKGEKGLYEVYINISAIIINSQASVRATIYFPSNFIELYSEIYDLPKIFDPHFDSIGLHVDDIPMDLKNCTFVTNKDDAILVATCDDICSCSLILVDTVSGWTINQGIGRISELILFQSRNEISITYDICQVSKTIHCSFKKEENYSVIETRERQVKGEIEEAVEVGSDAEETDKNKEDGLMVEEAKETNVDEYEEAKDEMEERNMKKDADFNGLMVEDAKETNVDVYEEVKDEMEERNMKKDADFPEETIIKKNTEEASVKTVNEETLDTNNIDVKNLIEGADEMGKMAESETETLRLKKIEETLAKETMAESDFFLNLYFSILIAAIAVIVIVLSFMCMCNKHLKTRNGNLRKGNRKFS